MPSWRHGVVVLAVCVLGILPSGSFAGGIPTGLLWPIQQPAQQNAIAKEMGAIKKIDGTTITLTADSGNDITVSVQAPTKILRVEPGQTDLKSATPIQLADLQAGDRILVQGKASPDAKTIAAIRIVAMKHADVEAKKEHEREDWDKRSVGGLVISVDAGTGTVSISVPALGGSKTTAVHTTNKTVFRRYAPDSVKFDDAKPSGLDQIKPGDQLRALGTRSADGAELSADAIVSGSFRNIAGTITSVDAAANSMIVMDLIAKKPVVVKITPQSQLRKLAPEAAQRIAFRLKGAGAAGGSPSGSPGGAGGGASGSGAARTGNGQNGNSQRAADPGGAGGNAGPGGARADLQQILNRMPAASISDFQKGDAVMVVSTEGTDSGGVTAITLLGGVEPILAAAPSGSQAMTLSPWSLGTGAIDAGANP
jgi:hypothetical protein